MFYIMFDLCMAVTTLILGVLFYNSKGKAARFLSGYNMRSKDERKKYNENEMCKAYGKRMMFMSLPFLFGMVIDFKFTGIGCLISWSIYLVMFILLLVDRHKRER